MVAVRPFRGWRFNPAVAGDLAALTCPPYDVISPAEQQAFAANPYNIIHIELGEATDTEDRYQRAARLLGEWQVAGVLRREESSSFYLYEQRFDSKTRRALFVDLKLEPWSDGGVVPHEHTMSGPKADRLALLEATQANVSPIFALYPDDPAIASVRDSVAGSEPAVDIADEHGDRHRLWVIDDPAAIDALVVAFAHRPVLIADGHHRYETALAYRDKPGAPAGADGILMGLVAEDDSGLVILPTHRTVSGIDAAPLDSALRQLGDRFAIEPIGPLGTTTERDVLAALEATAMPAFVVAGAPAGQVSLLTPQGDWRSALPAGHAGDWQTLDLVALHELLLRPLLGIDVDAEGEGRVRFTRDLAGSLDALATGEAQLAAFLHPPTARHIREISQAGDRMPHKSTYFAPKLRTGLVLRSLA